MEGGSREPARQQTAIGPRTASRSSRGGNHALCQRTAMADPGVDAGRNDHRLRRPQCARRSGPDPEEGAELHHGAVLLRGLVLPDRLLLLPAGCGLSDRSHRSAHRLCRRRPGLGHGVRPARLLDRMGFDGRLPRHARRFRGGRHPDRNQDLDHMVPLRRALDRHRLVQLGLVARRRGHTAAGRLALDRLRLAVRLHHDGRSGGRLLGPLVLALSRPAEPSAPVAGRVHPDRGRPGEGRGGKAGAQEDLRPEAASSA